MRNLIHTVYYVSFEYRSKSMRSRRLHPIRSDTPRTRYSVSWPTAGDYAETWQRQRCLECFSNVIIRAHSRIKNHQLSRAFTFSSRASCCSRNTESKSYTIQWYTINPLTTENSSDYNTQCWSDARNIMDTVSEHWRETQTPRTSMWTQ